MIRELEGPSDVIVEHALSKPSLAGGDRETEENRFAPGALSDKGEGIVKIFEQILAGGQRYVPLEKGARGGLLEANMPTRDLATKAGDSSMPKTAQELDSNREVAGEFGP
jgi:hypothetical protein